jgi:hypothetical protein
MPMDRKAARQRALAAAALHRGYSDDWTRHLPASGQIIPTNQHVIIAKFTPWQ